MDDFFDDPAVKSERITYRQLLALLQGLTEDQLDMDVTVVDIQENEFYAAGFVIGGLEDSVLDANHPVLPFPVS